MPEVSTRRYTCRESGDVYERRMNQIGYSGPQRQLSSNRYQSGIYKDVITILPVQSLEMVRNWSA